MTMPFEVPGLGVAATLRGERRYATVLLADVVNSTELLEAVGSEAWVEIMNRVFQIAGSEIYRYGGEIDQFRGDGLVAFFGATGAHENDPERAVLSGLRMQAAVRAYADTLSRERSIALNLRVGINTGEVIVTQVGDRARHFEQTAMGEAVALAARMETSAEPGTVLVSHNTYALVRSRFDWLPLGQVTVKGVSRPVAVYRPVGYRERTPEADHRRGREGLAALDSPLVGRQAEFRALQRAVQTVREGRGGVVTVVGEAGIGKSRLVAEVRLREERAAGRPLLWCEGRSLSLVGATPYLPWTAILRQLLGLTADVPSELGAGRITAPTPVEERALVRGRIAALGIGVDPPGLGLAETWQRADQQTVARALARILAIEPADDAAREAAAVGGLERALAPLARAVSAVLAAIASRFPLVLAFEDLHWADAASLALLEQVLPLIDQVPLLVICVMRPLPEGPPETDDALHSLLRSLRRYGDGHTRIRLESLGPDDVSEMVAHLLASCSTGPAETPVDLERADVAPSGAAEGGAECAPTGSPVARASLPAPVTERILAASGGNPYYVEEFVRSLIDRGHLVCDGFVCRWQGTGSGTSEVPDSLRGVLTARMDRLPSAARRCLQVGAVIGRIFSRGLLSAVLARTEIDGEQVVEHLQDHLRVLAAAQMIRSRRDAPAGGAQFIFKHQLMQEAAYNSLLLGERRQLHRQVAQALIALTETRAASGEVTALGEVPEALAGTLAHHWDAAGEPARAVPYYLGAGRQAQRAYAHDTARAAFRQALASIEAIPPDQVTGAHLTAWRFEALKGLGQVAFAVGRVDDAEPALRQAIALGREMDLPLSDLIRLYHWLGEVLFWQERYDERVLLGKEGLSLLDPKAETVEVALMNQMVAIGHLTQGVRGDFLDYTFRTAAFIEKLPYVPELLPAYEHIITAHIMTNEIGKAEAMLAALAERVDLEHDLATRAAIDRQTAELKLVRGDLHGALVYHTKALALYQRLADTKHRVWALGDMGWIRLQLGDIAGAAEWLAEMERTAPTLTHYRGIEYMMQGTTVLSLIAGDLDRAIHTAQTLLASLGEDDPPLRSAWAHFLLGQAHYLAGDPDAAVEHLRSSLRYMARAGENIYAPAAAAALCALALVGGSEAVDALPAAWQPAIPWGLVPARPTALAGAEVIPPPTGETVTCAVSAVTGASDGDQPSPPETVKEDQLHGMAILTGAWSPLRVERRLPGGHRAGAGTPSVTAGPASSDSAGVSRDGRGGSEGEMWAPCEWTWFDLLGDCDYAFTDGLALRAACGRDLWETNVSAPRILRPVTGDLTLQARVRPVEAGTPTLGGLLLYWDPSNHLRLDVGSTGPLSVGLAGALDNRNVLTGAAALPEPPGATGVVLRIERIGETVTALVSPDGDTWYRVGTATAPTRGPVWAGFCALGNIDRAIYPGAFPDGSAIWFDGVEMAVRA